MGRNSAPGNSRVSWAMRRTLLVPMRGARPSSRTTSSSDSGASTTSRQDDRVTRILALQHRADGESLRQDRRHVLAAVHREIDLAGQQRILDFLDEQSLAADLRQPRFRQPVAGRLDDDDVALDAGALAQQGGNRVCLPARELAAARSNT